MASNDSQCAVRCLGKTFDVRVNDLPIRPPRVKRACWLLGLLAAHHDRTVTRQWIVDRFWPESDHAEGNHSLRQCLWSLRQALGTEAARVLVVSRDHLGVDTAAAEIDIARFDLAVRKGDPDSLRQAVGLYGGPFLDGCDEPWAITERRKRQSMVLKALDALAEQARDASQPEAELECRRRATHLAPLDEPALRALMTCLHRAGDNTGMQESYRSFERALQREDPLCRPSQETVELHRALRNRGAKPVSPQSALPPPPPLPIPLTDLIGRDEEKIQIGGLLERKRLVTLTGPGGVGKTRLALTVGERAAEELFYAVYFVELASLNDPAQVVPAIANALRLHEDHGGAVMRTITRSIGAARVLLILDNCEHVVQTAATVAHDILSACSGARILATGREPLQITGERVWAVQPLGIPDAEAAGADEIAAAPAVQLFIERVQDVADGFTLDSHNAAAVASICRSLDGIPLALELGAVMMPSMSANSLAHALNDRFRVLTHGSRGAMPRHRTLAAMVEWSYSLLSDAERTLLRRLSVFLGGWLLSAAEEVCADTGGTGETARRDCTGGTGETICHSDVPALLASLVRKSLVTHTVSTGRYGLLETIRHYAMERLDETGNAAVIRTRHLEYFRGPVLPELNNNTEGFDEFGNLRTAIDWSLSAPGLARRGVAACGLLAGYANEPGILAEGRARIAALLKHPELREPCEERAVGLHIAGYFALKQADLPQAREFLREGLDLAREIGHKEVHRGTLQALGEAEHLSSHFDAARACFEESIALARADGDLQTLGFCQCLLGNVWEERGDLDRAERVLQESLALMKEIDHRFWPFALCGLGAVACSRGDYAEARVYGHTMLKRSLKNEDNSQVQDCLAMLARVAHGEGRTEKAAVYYGAMMRLTESIGALPYWLLRKRFVAHQETVRRKLGDDAYRRAYSQGHAMSWREAILYVLQDDVK